MITLSTAPPSFQRKRYGQRAEGSINMLGSTFQESLIQIPDKSDILLFCTNYYNNVIFKRKKNLRSKSIFPVRCNLTLCIHLLTNNAANKLYYDIINDIVASFNFYSNWASIELRIMCLKYIHFTQLLKSWFCNSFVVAIHKQYAHLSTSIACLSSMKLRSSF